MNDLDEQAGSGWAAEPPLVEPVPPGLSIGCTATVRTALRRTATGRTGTGRTAAIPTDRVRTDLVRAAVEHSQAGSAEYRHGATPRRLGRRPRPEHTELEVGPAVGVPTPRRTTAEDPENLWIRTVCRGDHGRGSQPGIRRRRHRRNRSQSCAPRKPTAERAAQQPKAQPNSQSAAPLPKRRPPTQAPPHGPSAAPRPKSAVHSRWAPYRHAEMGRPRPPVCTARSTVGSARSRMACRRAGWR